MLLLLSLKVGIIRQHWAIWIHMHRIRQLKIKIQISLVDTIYHMVLHQISFHPIFQIQVVKISQVIRLAGQLVEIVVHYLNISHMSQIRFELKHHAKRFESAKTICQIIYSNFQRWVDNKIIEKLKWNETNSHKGIHIFGYTNQVEEITSMLFLKIKFFFIFFAIPNRMQESQIEKNQHTSYVFVCKHIFTFILDIHLSVLQRVRSLVVICCGMTIHSNEFFFFFMKIKLTYIFVVVVYDSFDSYQYIDDQ